MGAKFLHTHVRTADAGAVVDALWESGRLRRFTAAADNEPCDHEVVVATDPSSPEWTSIYGRFDDVSSELSAALATRVVVTSIFDSDVLEAQLYSDGAHLDVFCNDPGYVGGSARSVKGQPRRWDTLCVEGKGWRDVQRAFKTAATNAEQALLDLGGLVGLSPRSLYPDHLDPASPGARRLRFRAPPAARRRIVEAAPIVSLSGRGEIRLSVVAGAQTFRTLARSAGGGSRGMEIAVGGAAIASGLIVVESIRFRGATASVVARTEADGAWQLAELPTAGLPAASALVDGATNGLGDADHFPSVLMEMTLVPMRAGAAELLVRWTPREPAAPSATERTDLCVDP